ncbi:WD repeat-containing protein 38 [Modicella reniformis]|uniref:WD repeat-containing protein 38 n=1 Tax=Modicella reniformis TaxID=1440133 RepID=A0A9P6ILX3_9FUNG|nr:WD repeat-containing protein 38 [Modicella reniformis]
MACSKYGVAAQVLLLELEKNGDTKKQALYQTCRDGDLGLYPLNIALPPLASPSLLDRVQNKLDVEGNLRQIRKQRLNERGNTVYIPPQAKPSLQAPDDALFPLMDKVQEFLLSEQKVLLLLGDSGAGKSTFSRELECNLWRTYKKKTGAIPLYINLPSIDKPEHDLIAKQLRKTDLTEPQIRELKDHRQFVLICDGYDESQRTQNLHTSNRLNQPGEWSAQMVISCRSEYIGLDYRDRFQPTDRNRRADPNAFQEAVIAPFSMDQVQEYIKQYASVCQPLWETKEYLEALNLIPSLKDLVKNPFLLSLSLEVLPRMVDPGQNLSTTRITRVELYDQFVEQWLERGKKRLGEKELSFQARSAFESLSDEGFTLNGIDYLKKLAVAIYKEQGGHPVVEYSRFKDEGSWKAEFFSRNEEEKQLLREACPLTKSGNQHRFIHRSLLEYGLSRAVFDPQDGKKQTKPFPVRSRRGSTSSLWSFEIQEGLAEPDAAMTKQPMDQNSPLIWRSFVNEASVLQFLSERVQQEPLFKRQLLAYIEDSKTDKIWRIAAANAITILIRAGVQFNGAGLEGIQIPGADLSHGMFDSAHLQGSDLRKVNLRNIWLRQADLSRTQMMGVKFGELPFLTENSKAHSCAYSPDGKTLTVGLDRGDISVYTTSTWEKIWTLKGHDGQVVNVVYSAEGNLVASRSWDGTVRLWEVETATCRHIFSDDEVDFTSVAYPSKGSLIATGGTDGSVRLWDVETGVCCSILTGHTGNVPKLVCSPKGDLIASGGDDTTYEDKVTCVAFSPKGDQLASGSVDMTVRLWDVRKGTQYLILTGHTNQLLHVVYSPNGDQVASGGLDRTVRLWDLETGAIRHVLIGHTDYISAVAYSPKGDVVASSSKDSTARLWDVETGACFHALRGHTSGIRALIYSLKGDFIVSSSEDTTVRLWDVETGASRRALRGHHRQASSVAHSPRRDLVASAGLACTVRLWDAETGACRNTLIGHDGRLSVVAFSPKGDQVASGSDDKTVRLWDVETGACRHTLCGHTGLVSNVVYSPSGNQIASSSAGDRAARLWEVETGICSFTLYGHDDEVSSIVYSPKGDLVASGSWDSTVRIWDVETGDCRRIFSGHTWKITRVVYSPNGEEIASCSLDRMVRLWDVETGTCRHALNSRGVLFSSVVYSPKGDQLATNSDDIDDGMVRLWDVKTGSCRYTLSGHNGKVPCVMYSTNGDMVVSGGEDMTMRLWDVASAGCDDGSVRLWQMTEEEGRCRVFLRWSSAHDVLILTGVSIYDMQGLSQANKLLLKQRGE